MKLDELIHEAAQKLILTGRVSKSTKWQGIENPNPLFQATKVYLGPADMPSYIKYLTELTKPNMPWAEKQFQERVSGKPLNPGNTYQEWPFYKLDKQMRTEGEQFTHTYMERFWPRYANIPSRLEEGAINIGIRYELGDLHDLMTLFVRDPETRQGFLPIWFPEDTGAVHGGRVPCTLGYLFQIVDDRLDMTYFIRSCDFNRHFRDDIYMAVRLAQHLLTHLRILDSKFKDTNIGEFDMYIGSLHIFNAELPKFRKTYGTTQP